MIKNCDICHTCHAILSSDRFCFGCGKYRHYSCHGDISDVHDSTPCPDTSNVRYKNGSEWIAEKRWQLCERSGSHYGDASLSSSPPGSRTPFRSFWRSQVGNLTLALGRVAMVPMAIILSPFAFLAWMAKKLDAK